MREHGIAEALGARDAGDLPVRIVGEDRDPASGIVGYPTVVATCEGVRDGIAPLLRSGAFTVVMGGCCSLVPGVAAALQLSGDGPVGLAYIDGHLDTYDPKTSPTGEAADMPVADCAGLGDRALVGLGPAIPLIDPAHIALLAHRDGDEALGRGLVRCPRARNRHVDRLRNRCRATGHDRPASASPRSWPTPPGASGFSIDVDVLSSAAMPATPVQQDGGLSLDELAELAAPLARHPACVGLDLLCYDVDMDDRAHTSGARLVALLARVLDGEPVLQRPDPATVLERADVRLEPLAAHHRAGLAAAIETDPAAFPLAGPVSGDSTLDGWLGQARERSGRGVAPAVRSAQRRRAWRARRATSTSPRPTAASRSGTPGTAARGEAPA